MLDLILQLAGALLMALVLVDAFLTVLYARVGCSLFSNAFGRLVWQAFRALGRLFPPERRDLVLSFTGPVMLVLLIVAWSVLLTVGGGLVFHPKMGTSIQAGSGGATPTDFVSAMFAAAGSLTINSSSDFGPRTTGFRLLYMANSLIGVCMLSLALTYVMQVYSALQRRNAAALGVEIDTAQTGDAAEIVAGLGPEGDFKDASTRLSEVATRVADVKETHHFYSQLIYFRSREPYYSAARMSIVLLDVATLIKSGLDDERYATLKESAAVTDLWRSSSLLLSSLAEVLLPEGEAAGDQLKPDDARRGRWERRYQAALRRFRQAGIPTIADEREGFERYCALRAQWDRFVHAYADYMAYDEDELDVAGSHPELSDARPAFRTRLRAVG